MMTQQQILAALEKPTTAEAVGHVIARIIGYAIAGVYVLIVIAAGKWAWQILF